LRDHIETLSIAEVKLKRNYSRFFRKLNLNAKVKLEKDAFINFLPLLSGNGLREQIEAACTKKQKLKKLANFVFKLNYFQKMGEVHLELAKNIFSSIEQLCKQFNISSV
jgi:hypothetical protein